MSGQKAFDGRKIINIYETPYQKYDLEGPVQDDISYIPLSYDPEGDRLGAYVIRMEPGAATIPHTHRQIEDFLILEGEVIESDGQVLKPGEFVHYEPGTHHNSRTETGCLVIGVDWRRRH